MMKTAAFLILITSTAFAQQHPYNEIYPSDYTPSPCASRAACESFTQISFEGAAAAFMMRDLDPKWNDAHRDELLESTKPYCVKRATCNSSPGRIWWFCNDIFGQELRATCDVRFDPKTRANDNTQCHTWMDTYANGVDQRGSADWKQSQECLKRIPPAGTAARQMDWWSKPAMIPADYNNGPIQIYAVDRETHVPVEADISFEGQIVHGTDAPTGNPTTYYVMKWPRRLVRVPNAEGHTDVVPVNMTITAPGYETVTTRVPTIVPKMIVSITPASPAWRRGINKITVNATDSLTGKAVEAQVFAGPQTLGFTNKPLDLKVEKKGRHPEVWVYSPFDAYGDVVAAPAKK